MIGAAWAGWGLVAVRLFALMAVQPVWRRIVGGWWWVLAAAFALALAPALARLGALGAPLPWLEWITLAGFELLLGAVLGLVVGLPGHALIGAMDASGLAVGLRGNASRVFTGLGLALVPALGLGLGLHRPLLASLAATVDLLPVGNPSAWSWIAEDSFGHVVTGADALTLLALALATPALLSVAAVDLALRLLGQGPTPASAMTEAIRPWLRTAVALVALGASWAAYPQAWVRGLG